MTCPVTCTSGAMTDTMLSISRIVQMQLIPRVQTQEAFVQCAEEAGTTSLLYVELQTVTQVCLRSVVQTAECE